MENNLDFLQVSWKSELTCWPGACGAQSWVLWKGKHLSTLQARRWARGQSESFGEDHIEARPLRDRGEWRNFVGFDAVPAVAALALVWLATVALVVIKQFTPFDPITLIYVLPVVVAATQWGIVPAMIAAIAGAAAARFLFFFFPPLYTPFWILRPAKRRRSDSIPRRGAGDR